MSEQDGTHSSTRQRRSRKTSTAYQKNIEQARPGQRPANDDKEGWKAYWEQQGQTWRTEPEIDEERQKSLAERRSIIPDLKKGIYPFKDIAQKLTRADIEWLLATHENGRGPVDWSQSIQRQRIGLDLRGADLRGSDLRGLPLARLRAGFILLESGLTDWREATVEQREAAAVHLEGANLSQAHLEKAELWRAHLDGATFEKARLEGANLFRARLEDVNLTEAYLAGADLRSAFLNNATTLREIVPYDAEYGFMAVADARWSGVNLAFIKWPQGRWGRLVLGDEFEANKSQTLEKSLKNRAKRLEEYEGAVRANRQLAVILRDQGLNEEADRFAYRAQLLQRVVWGRQRRPLKYILSWFLFVLAGYGYRPLRTVMIYLLVIGIFAIGYYEVTHVLHAQPYPLAWYEALILSVSSFHGRGFFQPVQSLGDPVAILASIEAVFGLLVEISFIATFTQRFFGK